LPYRIVFSPEAEAQLAGIFRHIAREASPDTVERFVNAIIDYCEAFDMFPQRGTSREDLRPGLRTIGFRRTATIAFSIAEDAPQSIRIAIPAAAMRCFA
jgi:toxin ParE1/3/4